MYRSHLRGLFPINRCHLGAYIADTYWGRYKTICVSIGIALIGHLLLIISALPPVLDNPQGAMGALSIAIIVMGLGTGGFKVMSQDRDRSLNGADTAT